MIDPRLVSAAIVLSACSHPASRRSDGSAESTSATPPASSPPVAVGSAGAAEVEVGAGCTERGLLDVAGLLADADQPCHAWLAATSGRVLALQPSASAVVWTRRTRHETGVIIGARHARGAGTSRAEGPDAPQFVDPSTYVGLALISWPRAGMVDGALAPIFDLFHPMIPSGEHVGTSFADLAPRYDFFVAAVDGQRSASGRPRFRPIVDGPFPMDDPARRTLAAPTWAAIGPDQRVLLVGVPRQGALAGRQAASTGRVLAEAEARTVLTELVRAGDAEGQLAFDPTVEAFVEATALSGMSGGGAFDTQGRLVGLVVRVTDRHPTRHFVRVVRMSYIVEQLDRARDALAPDHRDLASAYLE